MWQPLTEAQVFFRKINCCFRSLGLEDLGVLDRILRRETKVAGSRLHMLDRVGGAAVRQEMYTPVA